MSNQSSLERIINLIQGLFIVSVLIWVFAYVIILLYTQSGISIELSKLTVFLPPIAAIIASITLLYWVRRFLKNRDSTF